MKKNYKRILSLALMLVLVVAMALPVSAASGKINKKSTTLIKGQTTTLKVTGIKGKVKWSSSKKSVATVSSKGKVTAKKAGTTTIKAKVGKKTFKCTVKVEAPKLSKTSLTLAPGKYTTIKLNGTKQKVKWSTSNKAVATVSSSGKITAKKAGTATITAKVLGKSFKCKVTVKKSTTPTPKPTPTPIPFKSSDYSVTMGTKNVTVSFKKHDDVTDAQLEEEGFVKDSKGYWSKTCTVNTATYKFNKLPTNLEDLKQIKLGGEDGMFAPVAANIVALSTFEYISVQKGGTENNPIFKMFEYCMGGIEIPLSQRSNYPDWQYQNFPKWAYFDGATPSNNYTPNKPYTFTLEEGPYILPAKKWIGENYPERHMVLFNCGGYDGQRYCDVYQSQKAGQVGTWFCWKYQWQSLCSGVADPDVLYGNFEENLEEELADVIVEGTLKIEDADEAVESVDEELPEEVEEVEEYVEEIEEVEEIIDDEDEDIEDDAIVEELIEEVIEDDAEETDAIVEEAAPEEFVEESEDAGEEALAEEFVEAEE